MLIAYDCMLYDNYHSLSIRKYDNYHIGKMTLKDRYIQASGDAKKGKWAHKSLGLDPNTVTSIMRGSIPAADKVLALADALGVNYRWLVSGVGAKNTKGDEAVAETTDPYRLSDQERKLIDLYRGADPATRADAENLLDRHQVKSKKNARR